ncbi:hypothetical protein [Streptomyces sp. bgisy100]|uniref:hypothetical protein n=1 Tax=Streptomyces sp. bgisy100 TaxID=3413783 RepID=UPI003D739263
MWPGQQPPGGEQNPQNANPYQQPGYQQPGHQPPPPYQQQGYQQPGYQQPNPYQQPAPQWNTAVPGGPQPPRNNRSKATIAVVTAAAVVVAAAVTGVIVLGGEDESPRAGQGGSKQSASAAPSSSGAGDSGGGELANPRADSEVKPVVPGWKTVVNGKRHSAFDVPPDWAVERPGTAIGFTDQKDTSDFPKSLVTMTSPAYAQEKWCTSKTESGREDTTSLGAAGTKGAQGAKSTAEAAQNEALSWVFAAYDQKKTGTFRGTRAKPFKSDHGISGSTSSATVTGVKKTGKCTTDGKAFAVTYRADTGDLATWVLYTAKGVEDEIPDATIRKIMSTLRPLPSS